MQRSTGSNGHPKKVAPWIDQQIAPWIAGQGLSWAVFFWLRPEIAPRAV
jgi:hypothetical protein